MRLFIELCRVAIIAGILLACIGCFSAYAHDLHKAGLCAVIIDMVGCSVLSILNKLESKGSE